MQAEEKCLDLKSHQLFMRPRDLKECNFYKAGRRTEFQEFQQSSVVKKKKDSKCFILEVFHSQTFSYSVPTYVEKLQEVLRECKEMREIV